jgi:hypothetical protein
VATWSRCARALLWAVVAAFACDAGEDSTLEVVVRVDPVVQSATTSPSQVLVGFDSGSGGFVAFRVGFLCGPPAPPFVTTARFADASTASGATVHAWLAPLGAGMPVSCGPVPFPAPVASVPPPFAPGSGATAGIIVVGGCGAGAARSATLVIAVAP